METFLSRSFPGELEFDGLEGFRRLEKFAFFDEMFDGRQLIVFDDVFERDYCIHISEALFHCSVSLELFSECSPFVEFRFGVIVDVLYWLKKTSLRRRRGRGSVPALETVEYMQIPSR
jgi:hypothetical protein